MESALVDAGPRVTARTAREERATRLRSLEAIAIDVRNGGREKSVWARREEGRETDVEERKAVELRRQQRRKR